MLFLSSIALFKTLSVHEMDRMQRRHLMWKMCKRFRAQRKWTRTCCHKGAHDAGMRTMNRNFSPGSKFLVLPNK